MHTHIETARGRRLDVLGETVEIKLTQEDTGGAYTLVEVESPPGGGAAMLHTHPAQETFYVLEGEYELHGPDGTIRACEGDVVHVPFGAAHGYRNIGPTRGRVLAMFEPPARMLELFEALDAEPLATPERTFELFHEHDVRLAT